ncbi:Maltose/maltodextrin transport ATP-binding protein MalK (EC [Olavius sp. associated proteobacterium Delta 1]|nr:Maltose/maltodextrin transport ATP-binding protein MalK (EC [Olavius sp. associated proteobacterium Delta 1]
MSVAFQNVSKRFSDGTLALDNLEFEFSKGEFIIFLGPSGSGKTTACRCLAGLEEITSGQALVDGKDITHLPPRERNMSMVFQNYALYSHKIVYENIAYPLRIRKYPRAKIDQMVKDVAKLLQIDHYLGRKPRQLSGGQAQRVAVARALVWQPSICLMDEPLSNLDAILRLQTRTELKRLHEELKCTFVFVTHDQEEAMTLGTRIIVLNHGKLIQFDSPKKIYTEPATRFVAEFIGRPAMNTIEGKISNGRFQSDQLELSIAGRAAGKVVLGIRPEHIVLQREPQIDFIPFTLDVVELVQPDTLLFVKKRRGDPVSVVVRIMEDCSDLSPRDTIYLKFPQSKLHFFDIATGERLP